jgi:hypothetical protein
LGAIPEADPVRGSHLERQEHFRYGPGDGRMVWLECWNGLPRSGGVGLPVEVRVGIFDVEVRPPN